MMWVLPWQLNLFEDTVELYSIIEHVGFIAFWIFTHTVQGIKSQDSLVQGNTES